jgi:hypothetical protein
MWDDMSFNGCAEAHAFLRHEEDRESHRLGIPQGSAASSLVAEYVVAAILRDFAGQLAMCRVINYSDNFGILCQSGEAAVLQESLTASFAAHEAGGFQTRASVSRVDTPFRFLGYNFVNSRGRAPRAFVPAAKLEQKRTEFTGRIANARNDRELLDSWSRICSWSSAFVLCEASRGLMEDYRETIRRLMSPRLRRLLLRRNDS